MAETEFLQQLRLQLSVTTIALWAERKTEKNSPFITHIETLEVDSVPNYHINEVIW